MKLYKIIAGFFTLIFSFQAAYSQKLVLSREGSNWLCRFNAAITFNTTDGKPVCFNGSAFSNQEGVAAISDRNGNLLFYTEGQNVYNKQHKRMPNGFYLYGQESSTQSGIIVPKPLNKNIYNVVTLLLQTF